MRASDKDMLAALVVGMIVVILIGALGMHLADEAILENSHPTDVKNVPCQEDEVVAVRIDPDPSHGLSWHCVNAQEFVHDFLYGEGSIECDTFTRSDLVECVNGHTGEVISTHPPR